MPPKFIVTPQMIDYWVSQLGNMAAIIFSTQVVDTHTEAADAAIKIVDAIITVGNTQGIMQPIYTDVRIAQKP